MRKNNDELSIDNHGNKLQCALMHDIIMRADLQSDNVIYINLKENVYEDIKNNRKAILYGSFWRGKAKRSMVLGENKYS